EGEEPSEVSRPQPETLEPAVERPDRDAEDAGHGLQVASLVRVELYQVLALELGNKVRDRPAPQDLGGQEPPGPALSHRRLDVLAARIALVIEDESEDDVPELAHVPRPHLGCQGPERSLAQGGVGFAAQRLRPEVLGEY